MEDNSILNPNNIDSKLKHYYDIFSLLKEQISSMKKRVIIHYSNLTLINSIIHMSIIIFTSTSTFVQSAVSNDESKLVKYITMGTTTYSGLILALSKFYKLEEKKETSHNLRDRFADLEGKVCICIEMLQPWGNKEHYQTKNNGEKVKDKETEWTTLIEKMDSEYINIIEIKKELCTGYDKLFDNMRTIENIEDQFYRVKLSSSKR